MGTRGLNEEERCRKLPKFPWGGAVEGSLTIAF